MPSPTHTEPFAGTLHYSRLQWTAVVQKSRFLEQFTSQTLRSRGVQAMLMMLSHILTSKTYTDGIPAFDYGHPTMHLCVVIDDLLKRLA